MMLDESQVSTCTAFVFYVTTEKSNPLKTSEKHLVKRLYFCDTLFLRILKSDNFAKKLNNIK